MIRQQLLFLVLEEMLCARDLDLRRPGDLVDLPLRSGRPKS
jgi:hypothetical protein